MQNFSSNMSNENSNSSCEAFCVLYTIGVICSNHNNNQCGVSLRCVLFQKFCFRTDFPSPSFSICIRLVLIRLKHVHWADCQRIYSNLQHLESGIRFVFDYNCVTLLDQWLSRLCISTDQPKLFIIVIWFCHCWTIYTFLCLISFCASVHQANGTLPQWVVEHTCNVSSYRFVFPWILLSVHIWGIYTNAPLKHHVNELSDITLYDEICPHCTLHMMNW